MATPQEIEQQRLLNQQLLGQAIKVQDQDKYPSASLALGDSILGSANQNAAPAGQERPSQQQSSLGNTNQQSRLGGLFSGIAQSLIGSAIQQPQLSATPMQATTPELAAVATQPTGAVAEFLLNPDRPTGEQAQAIAAQQTEALTTIPGPPAVIPAPSDMLPNVPVGTGTVLKGPKPMSAFQDIRGIDPNAPVQSAPKGMVRTIDPNTGQPIFADKATAAQFADTINARRQADFNAQQSAIQKLAGSDVGFQRMDSSPSGEYAAASAARQARAMQESTFMEPVSDNQRSGGGLSQSQMRRYMKGKNPNASDREKAYSATLDLQMAEDKRRSAAATNQALLQQKQALDIDKMVVQKELDKPSGVELETKIANLEKIKQEVIANKSPNQKNIQTAMTALGIANANDIIFNLDGSVEIEDAGFNTIYKIGSPQHKMIMQAFGMPQESTITGVSGKRTSDGYSM